MFRRSGIPSALTSIEQDARKTREFTGDGSAFLKVPGLLVVLGVAVATASGRVSLPLTEERAYMVHPDDTVPRENVTEDIFALDTQSYETPVLMRSEISNHGRFQKDVTFYITGEWAEEPAEPEKAVSRETGEGSESDAPKANVPPSAPTGDGQTKDSTDANEGENFVDTGETFENLPDHVKVGLKSFVSPQEALDATNEQFNAAGIKGLEISQAKAALKRALKSAPPSAGAPSAGAPSAGAPSAGAPTA